jgi:tol-pal system protein YbgF
MPNHGCFRNLLVALGVSVAIAVVSPAAAQNSEMQSLVDQIERLRNDIVDLQRTVFKGEPPPPNTSTSGALGGMTAERAAQIEVRVSQVEDEMRSLTGRVEEVGHDIDGLGERLDKLAEDLEFRLTAIERKQTATPSATSAAPPQGAAETARASDGTQTLGTIPQAAPSAEQPAATQTATLAPALPPGTPEEQYKYANDLLRQMEYGEAERALKAFIEAHPSNDLTGNAYYWLAETFYVRGNYEQAAQYFARGFQDFPKSIKAPDNLLKLAMSLAKLGRKDDACVTFKELGNRFPQASSAIKQLATNERRRVGCS